MSKEIPLSRLRMNAFQILAKYAEMDLPFRYHVAAIEMRQSLGLGEETTMRLVDEFIQSKQNNEMPGNITRLPDPDPSRPPLTQEELKAGKIRLTEQERHIGNFTLAYAEHTLGFERKDFEEKGRFWLGNTLPETKQLVTWMWANPEKVADYLEWCIGKPGEEERDIVGEFRQKAQGGNLIKPRFNKRGSYYY